MVSTICGLSFILLIASVASNISADSPNKKVFDVRNYGARGDGKSDDTIPFTNAWKEACGWSLGHPRVYVPLGTFLLGGLNFSGPCKSRRISFIIKGTLLAPEDHNIIKEESWITFKYIDHLTVSGGGTIDGQGQYSWHLNDCRTNSNCNHLPMNIGFSKVRNSRIHHIKSVNSKMAHFNFFAVDNFNISKVSIRAPETSPNTDGIKIGSSSNMRISDVIIETGDDCIAILSGTTKLDINKVNCGPGHGVSVGSLGRYLVEDPIYGITVRNSVFNGTSQGVRIKSWASSPSPNLVSNFLYKNLQMINVGHPINIDQQYCPTPPCNNQTSSKIQIHNVKFYNIWGTSSNKLAVRLQCSKSFPCKDVELFDVKLEYNGPDGPATSMCEYVNGKANGQIYPPSCIP